MGELVQSTCKENTQFGTDGEMREGGIFYGQIVHKIFAIKLFKERLFCGQY